MKRIAWVFALVTFAASTGCYHYVPVTPAAAPQGTPVRARLSSMSSFELSQITVNNIDQVEGEMIRVDGGSLFLSATWLQAVTGNGYAGNGWTVSIPQDDMVGLEERRLSLWRTGIVVGGLLAGTWLTFDALGLGPSFGGGGGGPGNTR